MAHKASIRKQARNLYVYERQSFNAISAVIGVSASTIRRWKTQDAQAGDNWDLPRAAALMVGQTHDEMIAEAVEGFAVLYQASVKFINEDSKLDAAERVKLMASLADSFSKMMTAAGKASPSLSKLAIAHEVITALAKFVHAQGKDSPAATAFLELIEPFGEHLAKDPKWK